MQSRFRLGTFAEAVEFEGDPTQRGFKVECRVVKVDYEPVAVGKKAMEEENHHLSSPLWVGPT